MKTGKDYLTSLRDGRQVYVHGARVDDVTTAPGLREPAEEIARGYDRFFDPAPGAYHPMFEVPRSAEDLRARIKMVFEADFTAFNSAACLALLGARGALRTADPVYVDRIERFVARCRAQDVLAVPILGCTPSPDSRRYR